MSKDTSNAVTIRQDSDVDLVTFSEERIALIRKKLAPNAPDLEFDYWIAKCQKRGLNPLIGQSYLVPRKSGGQTNWVEQTGIDGLRLIAGRTREYAGVALRAGGALPVHRISVLGGVRPE
jgi:hypothetical protein